MAGENFQTFKKTLNESAILNELERYNDDELFYKQCYCLRHDETALNSYIRTFTVAEIESRYLIIPEGAFPHLRGTYSGIMLSPESIPFKMTEKHHWASASGQFAGRDIFLQKHNRYSPVFQHSHEFFEIFYCLAGECVSTIGEKQIHFSAGNMCFIAPDTVHTMEVFDDSLIINFFIKKSTFDEMFFNLLTTNDILSRFFMGSLFLQNPAQQCIIFDTGSDRGLLEELFALLDEQSINDTYSNRIMENRIEIFFALLIRKYGKTPLIHDQTQKENDHWDMIAYINENFRTVTLSKIARKFNFETSYCSRLIKACTGKNFTALLCEIRMRYAKKLLLDSSERIYDISYSLGFENQETFIRAFKKNCGVTPSQFRVSYRGL